MERGIHASFMPEPLADAPGSGMHTHLSLFEGDSNAFYEAGQETRHLPDRPPVRRRHPAPCGRDLRGHRPVRQLVQAPVGRSRGAQATSAGATTTSSALLRIPQYKPGKGRNSARMEFRATRPGGQPVPGLLGAARRRSRRHRYSRCTLGEPTSDDVWELTDAERQAMGIRAAAATRWTPR